MSDQQKAQQNQRPTGREPAILLPGVVTVLLGLMAAVHVGRSFVLNESGDLEFLTWFAFIPYRGVMPAAFEGGWIPLLWTPITHAFLHADWEHLILNCAWLAIFGTPVARRYGARATLILFFASTLAGAAAFAVTTLPNLEVLIGASGGIAGLTGAACRFIFQPVLTMRHPETGELVVLGRKMATLGDLARHRQALLFISIWLILNAAVPFLPILIGQSISVAWQAHLGGFFAGLFLTPLFERRPREQTP